MNNSMSPNSQLAVLSGRGGGTITRLPRETERSSMVGCYRVINNNESSNDDVTRRYDLVTEFIQTDLGNGDTATAL